MNSNYESRVEIYNCKMFKRLLVNWLLVLLALTGLAFSLIVTAAKLKNVRYDQLLKNQYIIVLLYHILALGSSWRPHGNSAIIHRRQYCPSFYKRNFHNQDDETDLQLYCFPSIYCQSAISTSGKPYWLTQYK